MVNIKISHKVEHNYLIKNCNEFVIRSDNDDNEAIARYLKNNKLLTDKKIVIGRMYELGDYLELKALFEGIPNLYFKINGNDDLIKLDDFEKTFKYINHIVNKIKRYNYSPLEQVMYAYDLVRDRVYKRENDGESYTTSRDLTSVVMGDKIVCVGFSNIFEQVLLRLGIKTMQDYIVDASNDSLGHVRNMVYIDDSKYDVKGVYYFDVTWDSKNYEADISYLDSYRFFAKTKKEMDVCSSKKFISRTFKALDDELFFDAIDYLETDMIEEIPNEKLNTINTISRFIDNNDFLIDFRIKLGIDFLAKDAKRIINENKDKIIDVLCTYNELFDSSISADVLLKVLYTVRKNEYYENSCKYPFDLSNFIKVVQESGWIFSEDKMGRLYKEIFSDGVEYSSPIRYMYDYVLKNELDKEISQVKLTKVLSKIRDKRCM